MVKIIVEFRHVPYGGTLISKVKSIVSEVESTRILRCPYLKFINCISHQAVESKIQILNRFFSIVFFSRFWILGSKIMTISITSVAMFTFYPKDISQHFHYLGVIKIP